jgi:hypothetical protein
MTTEEWYETQVRPLRQKFHAAISGVLTEVQPEDQSAVLAALLGEITAFIKVSFSEEMAERFEAHTGVFFMPEETRGHS